MTNVLSGSSSLNKIQKTTSPERPKELPCDVYHISVKGDQYFVLVTTGKQYTDFKLVILVLQQDLILFSVQQNPLH